MVLPNGRIESKVASTRWMASEIVRLFAGIGNR